MKLLLAQCNFVTGAVATNLERALSILDSVNENDVDAVLFPELFLTGYPPEDLLYRNTLYTQVHDALERLCQRAYPFTIIIGHPEKDGDKLYNQASVIQNGKKIAVYSKQHLPNYNVFDEKRYFTKGAKPCVVDIQGIACGITICEDLWHEGPCEKAKAAGAKLILSINASPFYINQAQERIARIGHRAKANSIPIAYVNFIGAQDELVFDGGSMLLDAAGKLQAQSPYFQPDLLKVDIATNTFSAQPIPTIPNKLELIYQALTLGVKDYVHKNGFKQVMLGLSGGIDSSLTLAIAVDAFGPENVHAVLMPSQYTDDMSNSEAIKQCQWLGCTHETIAIEALYHQFMSALAPSFEGKKADLTEQNLQARIRGTLLMALSNKTGRLVLTTGNKSEYAVGYATLYGDMCGAFAVIKDVKKMLAYELAKYRNTLSKAIPEFIIEREPSAELAPDQKDVDSLPPYPILDEIIERYIEKDQSIDDIIESGIEKSLVKKVIRLIHINEYKRQQAAIGTRITHRAFGKDRRYPITEQFLDSSKI